MSLEELLKCFWFIPENYPALSAQLVSPENRLLEISTNTNLFFRLSYDVQINEQMLILQGIFLKFV